MVRRRIDYEQAFEGFLRARRVPYVGVDEARRALVPEASGRSSLKSFDFVVYASDRSLLVDVKGRAYRGGRLERWATERDIDAMRCWQRLFGPAYEAVLVFIYRLHEQPPDALFEQVFSHGASWYALREIAVSAYERAMHLRSQRWRTVDVPWEAFQRLSRPLHLRGGRLPGAPVRAGPGHRSGDEGRIDQAGALDRADPERRFGRPGASGPSPDKDIRAVAGQKQKGPRRAGT